MTKQDLLTKLAVKCTAWAAARSDLAWLNSKVSDDEVLQVEEEEWHAERKRLLTPQWEGVPERYKFVALHGDGRRWFFVNPPTLRPDRGLWELASSDGYHDYWEDENPPLTLPAGYWKESLEERPV